MPNGRQKGAALLVPRHTPAGPQQMAPLHRCAAQAAVPASLVLLLLAVIASAAGNDCCRDCVRCASSDKCIPHSYLCDGYLDCEGAEEENPNFCTSYLATTKECPLGQGLCNSTCLSWREICSDRDRCRPKPNFDICFAIQKSKLNRKHIVAEDSIQITEVGFLEEILDSGSPSSIASLRNSSLSPAAATAARPVTSSSPTTATRNDTPDNATSTSAPNQDRPTGTTTATPDTITTTPFPRQNLHIPPQLVKVRRPPPPAGDPHPSSHKNKNKNKNMDVKFRKPFNPNQPNIANRPPQAGFQSNAFFVRPSMAFALNANFVPGQPIFQMVPRPEPRTTTPSSTQVSTLNPFTSDGGPPPSITPNRPSVPVTNNDRPTDSSTTSQSPLTTIQSSDLPPDSITTFRPPFTTNPTSSLPTDSNRPTRPVMVSGFDPLMVPNRPSRPNRPNRPPPNSVGPSPSPSRPSRPNGDRPLPDRLGPARPARPALSSRPPNNPETSNVLLVQYIGGAQPPVPQLSETPPVPLPEILSLQELQDLQNTGTTPDLLSLQRLQALQNSLPGSRPNAIIRNPLQIQKVAAATLPEPSCCDHCLRCARSSSCIAHSQICDGVGDCSAREDEDPSFCAIVQQDHTCPAGMVSCHAECMPWAEACRSTCKSNVNFEMCFVVRLNRLSSPPSQPIPPTQSAPLPQELVGGGPSADWVAPTSAAAGNVGNSTASQEDQLAKMGQQQIPQQHQQEQQIQQDQQNDQQKQQAIEDQQDPQLIDVNQKQDEKQPQVEKLPQDQQLPNVDQVLDQDLLQDQDLPQDGEQPQDQELLQDQDRPHNQYPPQNQDRLQSQDLTKSQTLQQNQDRPQNQDLPQDQNDLPQDQNQPQDQNPSQDQDLPHDPQQPQDVEQSLDQDLLQDQLQLQDEDQPSPDQHQNQDQDQPPNSARCPVRYTELGGVCYTTLPFLVTWHLAQSLCRSVTGQLVQFTDATQLEAVSKHLLHNDYPTDFWIGGFYNDDMQAWSWVSGSPMPMSTPFWALMYQDECVFRKDSKDSPVQGCFHYTQAPVHSEGGYCAALDFHFFYHITDHSCLEKKKIICSRPKL